MKRPRIFTVGHSTRSIDEFVELLRAHGVKGIVDIRSIPRSRHNPQFNADVLEHSLEVNHMSYKHIKELGGLRHAEKIRSTSAGEMFHSGASRITWQPRSFQKDGEAH